MKAAPFRYVAATSTEEAAALLREHGDEARVLAGGQSLLAMMSLRLAQPGLLVDIGRAGLSGARVGDELELGATTTQTEAMLSDAVGRSAPLLCRALAHVGHHALRNRGTVGGSVAHADPAAELPAVVLALAGSVIAHSAARGPRAIGADDLFLGPYQTALEPDELLTAVRLPVEPPHAWGFYEVARRPGDFALAGAAAALTLNATGSIASARIALFGVGPRATRVHQAEDALRGAALTDTEAHRSAAAIAAAAVEPPSDAHASATYRRRVAGVAVRRALASALDAREAA